MAESWTTITAAMVRAALSEMEYDTFAAAGITPGAADPVTQAIRQVVARIQGAVGASGKNTVGPAGMVPPELEGVAMILIMETLSSRVPQAQLVWDDIRKGLLKDAKDQLQSLMEGKWQTTAPEEESETGRPADGGSYGGEDVIDFTNLR